MASKLHQQIRLAQTFLRSPRLVQALLETSSLTSSDIVYEIGPGRGIITAALARQTRKVTAIEKDPILARYLCTRFQAVENVEIVAGDFLQYRIADKEYKIVANLPYNRTADMVRKILQTAPVPGEAYLIIQKEAAQKFSGVPNETRFSLLAKPIFEFHLLRELKRTDFEPVPRVDSVLLQIKKRPAPLVEKEDLSLYRDFISYGFGRWKHNLKLSFKSVFSYLQWKHVSKDLCFPRHATPSPLTFEQWLGLWECFKQRVPGKKQAAVKGYMDV